MFRFDELVDEIVSFLFDVDMRAILEMHSGTWNTGLNLYVCAYETVYSAGRVWGRKHKNDPYYNSKYGNLTIRNRGRGKYRVMQLIQEVTKAAVCASFPDTRIRMGHYFFN